MQIDTFRPDIKLQRIVPHLPPNSSPPPLHTRLHRQHGSSTRGSVHPNWILSEIEIPPRTSHHTRKQLSPSSSNPDPVHPKPSRRRTYCHPYHPSLPVPTNQRSPTLLTPGLAHWLHLVPPPSLTLPDLGLSNVCHCQLPAFEPYSSGSETHEEGVEPAAVRDERNGRHVTEPRTTRKADDQKLEPEMTIGGGPNTPIVAPAGTTTIISQYRLKLWKGQRRRRKVPKERRA